MNHLAAVIYLLQCNVQAKKDQDLSHLTFFFNLSYIGIVYCFSRKDSVTIASSLKSHGIKAACYHGDLDSQSRSQVHRAWTSNAIQVGITIIKLSICF